MPFREKAYISDFFSLDSFKNFVLSASINEDLIKKYWTKLNSFGVKPFVVTPLGYATAIKFIEKNEDLKTFAFLHINDFEYTLVLVHNRQPCKVRFFDASLFVTTKKIAIAIKQTIIGFKQRTDKDLELKFDLLVILNETMQQDLSSGFSLKDLDNESKDKTYFLAVDEFEENLGENQKVKIIKSKPLLEDMSPDKNIKYLFNFCKGKYSTNSFKAI